MIRRILTAAVALFGVGFAAGVSGAQTPGTLGTFAYDYAYSIQSQQSNIYTFAPYSICNQTAGSRQFFPFATNAPVYIQDVVAANSERLTPAAVIKSSTSCGVSIAPANVHNSFRINSGTAGLQESLNSLAVASLTYPRTVFLDDRWKSQIAAMGLVPATVIAAVVGNTKVVLVDLTVFTAGRWASYAWSGTAYVAQ